MPITAENPQDALNLIRTWLKAWAERNEEPLANQLPALYKTATIYFNDLYSYLRKKNKVLSLQRIVISRDIPWSNEERTMLSTIAQTSPRVTFVVSLDKICSNVKDAMQLLEKRLTCNVNMWFSVKSFPSGNLIAELVTQDTNIGFSVASQRELESSHSNGDSSRNFNASCTST